MMALRKFLILRRPRQRPSRRTHAADPANSDFLPSLRARPEDRLREAISSGGTLHQLSEPYCGVSDQPAAGLEFLPASLSITGPWAVKNIGSSPPATGRIPSMSRASFSA